MTSSTPTPPARSATGRLRSLDGIRGLAATAVLLHHWLLIAAPWLSGTVVWAWISQSPAKIFTVGTEAVLIFFVLSGLVVVLPVFKPGFSWTGFLAARVVRLYGPVIVALLFAAALIMLVPRTAAMPEGSWMADTHATSVALPALVEQITLLPHQYPLDNPLWSLRWEVIFSVLLPIAVAIALLVRRWSFAAALLCCALSVVGRITGLSIMLYLPLFLIGTIMATRLPELLAWAHRPRPRWFWPLFTVASLALLTASWLCRPFAPAGTELSEALWALAAPGAAGVVLVGLGWPAAGVVLRTRVVQWLGKVSFSLYLVHVPILATLAYAFGSENWGLVGLVGIPLSFLVAWGFYHLIEAKLHRVARRVQQSVAARARSRVVDPLT
ncbi:acyltransferase family protein [Microbacterium fluvii]|uniref:Acyltransferase family protein n=1 Tax=Microbacterium fluvii TaxID=415215 RepID=A0ABW2HDK7_9MICO|nr:acyltransferase [Microbacterium fluvii]MCU4672213.1 acyltransferase [Microbacterium fluvii]